MQSEASERMADEIVAVWRQVGAELIPLIGRLGMAVLFRRTLSLCVGRQPWLALVRQTSDRDMALDDLRAACAAQDAAIASEAGRDLFRTLHDLLGSLVGASLTEQLLSNVGGTFYIDVKQDSKP